MTVVRSDVAVLDNVVWHAVSGPQSDLADRVYSEWGRVDLLINNAAVAPPGLSLQEPL